MWVLCQGRVRRQLAIGHNARCWVGGVEMMSSVFADRGHMDITLRDTGMYRRHDQVRGGGE